MTVTAPTIYRLEIQRFRGIESLVWKPRAGVNVILGGGDVGKTTLLDAIGLLLSPSGGNAVSDTDYYLRDEAQGFSIEAVIALPESSGIDRQTKEVWPWLWSAGEAIVPSMEAAVAIEEPVYKIRVRGTEGLELLHEIVQPDGFTDHLSVGLRRAIGLVRLSGDDRNDRDLRLVHGSALDRLLSDRGLRARMQKVLAGQDVKSQLGEEEQQALASLDATFRDLSLPDGLDLSIVGSQGTSIAALSGLTAKRQDVSLPLSSWGSGTRRLAALAVAEQKQGEAPIALVDEIERGLEPCRQCLLVDKLQTSTSQAFVTTHSPPALAAATKASVWYIDHQGHIGSLDRIKAGPHRAKDPEAFLSRLTIVAEGETELGFVSVLLRKAFPSPLRQLGIHITDGGGHDHTCALLEALAKSGLRFGGFADEEGRWPGKWAQLHAALGPLLFRWAMGDIESNILEAVPDDRLETFIDHTDKGGRRLRTLADRLELGEDKSFAHVHAKAGATLKTVIIEAARGVVPAGKEVMKKEYKAHAQAWFKGKSGGEELATKMFEFDLWPIFRGRLVSFCNAARGAAGLSQLEDLLS